MYTLENNQLRIQVSTLGAELKSLFSKTKNKEYLWQADPRWWGRSAPHLFPRIGYETNEYIKDNDIIKHGYARDSEFKLLKKSEHELIFELANELQVVYRIFDASLEIEYKVFADFPFMIGGHPAFNIDELPIEIRLKNKECYKLKDGVIDRNKTYQLSSEVFTVDKKTFEDDAYVFINDYELNQVMLGCDLTMAYDSELLGVWSPPGAPFVCLEPWWIVKTNYKIFLYKIKLHG